MDNKTSQKVIKRILCQKPKPTVCRYCLADTNKHNQYYFLSDETKVYEKMVSDTFNIQICQLMSCDRVICAKCAEDIHSAANTKKKFVNAQKRLLEQSEMLVELGCDSLKQEMDSTGDEYSCEDAIEDDNDDKGLKCDDVILKICAKENEEKDCSKEVVLKSEPMHMDEAPLHAKIRKTTKRTLSKKVKKSLKVKDATKHVKMKVINKTNDKFKEKPRQYHHDSKIYSNSLQSRKITTLKLLFNSNMILFKSKRTRYACYACKETYLDIRQLREHSQSHPIEDNADNFSRCRGLTYKNVDISNLTCKKCSTPCRDLNELLDHLKTTHEEVFETPEHLLLPFKLEEGFKCVICQESFFTFCRLSIHMNSHSTSNVCETCGVAYTNRLSLRNHIRSAHTKQKCPKCSTVFPNKSAKAKHMRKAHNSFGAYKRYCLKCEMTFTYTYQLAEHMIEKHGVKRQTRNCEYCGKQFPSPGAVKVHTRAVHVGERNHPCGICDMRFFTSYDKRRHERTHGEEKSFSCDFCEVKFKSRDSVRRHLKKQHAQ